jgi:predicted nucleotidyltransferase
VNVRERLIAVARHLGELNSQVVYVGGSAVHFLVPQPLTPGLRHTEDVDLIVPLRKYHEIQSFSEAMRKLGFVEWPEDGVICRWKVAGIVVDVMPIGEAAFGFANRWYPQVVQDAIEQEVEPGLHCRFPSLPTYLATKLEAFSDRGGGDYWGDSDFEDIVVILAYCREVIELIERAPEPVRTYIVSEAKNMLNQPRLNEFVGACFDDLLAFQSAATVLACLRKLSRQST